MSRAAALEAIDRDSVQLYGYDIDPTSIESAQVNAKKAGVGDDIIFEQKDVKDLSIDQQYGIVISNPPYGIKIGDFQEMNQIYISLHKTFRKKMGWSIYILTADKKFPNYFKFAPSQTGCGSCSTVIEVKSISILGRGRRGDQVARASSTTASRSASPARMRPYRRRRPATWTRSP